MLLTVILGACFFRLQVRYDSLHYYEPVRSLLIDGDLNAYNEREYWTDRRWPGFTEVPLFQPRTGFLGFMNHPDRTATGYKYSFFPAGNTLLLLPGAAAGNLLARAAAAAGSSNVADGYAPLNLLVTSAWAMFLGSLGLALTWQMCRQLYGTGPAHFALAAVLLTHNVLPYLVIDSLYSHSLALLLISAFLALWLHIRERPTMPLIMLWGLIGGLIPTVRYQDIPILLIPVFDAALGWCPSRRAGQTVTVLLLRSAAFAAGVAAAVAPQLAMWWLHHGTIVITAQAMGTSGIPTFHPWRPDVLGLLFSNLHGLFSWTPFTAAAVAGLLLVPFRHRRLGIYLLLLFAIQTYYNSCRSEWWNLGYGIRRYANYSPFFALGFAALFYHSRKRWAQAALCAALGVAAMANLTLMAQYYDGSTLDGHGPDFSAAVGRAIPYTMREYRIAWLPLKTWPAAALRAAQSLERRGTLFAAVRDAAQRWDWRTCSWLCALLLSLAAGLSLPFWLATSLHRAHSRSGTLVVPALVPLSLALWFLVSGWRTDTVWQVDLATPAKAQTLAKTPLGRRTPYAGENRRHSLSPGETLTVPLAKPFQATGLRINIDPRQPGSIDRQQAVLTIAAQSTDGRILWSQQVRLEELVPLLNSPRLIPGEPRASGQIAPLRILLDSPIVFSSLQLTAPATGVPLRISALAFEGEPQDK